MNENKTMDFYKFTHPLNYNKSVDSNTYFNISENIKTDLDLHSNQSEQKIKLYDFVLNDISKIKKSGANIQEKTKSQQRVYDVLTNTIFSDKHHMESNKQIIEIVGTNLNEELLEKTIQQQEIIESSVFNTDLNSSFYETYNYIDYKPIDFVNRSSKIMGFLNIYTLSTPLISLIMPLILLLIPFFTLRIQGVSVSFSNYFAFLKQLLSRIPAFRIFTFASNDTIGSKISGLMAFILYFIQVYYNTKYCSRYIDKNHDIHNNTLIIKNVVNNSIKITNAIKEKFNVNDNTVFFEIYNRALHRLDLLETLREKLMDFEDNYSVLSMSHVNTVGQKLKIFYEMVSNYKGIQSQLKSVFDMNTFFYYYKNIHTNIKNKYLTFYENSVNENEREETEETEETEEKFGNSVQFKDLYFPMLLIDNDNEIKHNSINIDKSYIISGPNASGKTTLLKSVLFNICCTQQFGCGFYSECIMKTPYSVIESYINILDTHDRNSLFQNEAQRMLSIINKINDCEGKMFFVFDELFSGTNPKEAVSCGIACLEEILKHNNVNIILTTHYNELCKHFNQASYSNIIENKQMECYYNNNEISNKIVYNYLMKNGMSSIYGGLSVLDDLKYQTEIIKRASEVLHKKGISK